ncbi:hypothetical protein [Mycolicibacterium mucogenicum]|uniref:Uncharacterized protein n=1 Tax=Mycolicibacterium mucogenicum DSM 44124 TaxID=1226753 RepID=A0A8H2J937_MYCMU|nr:hypothetical protein [Mycolicibacterium mucogenicum]QPG70013.1 hypothetical protein C1S78_003010 [Mycolicibacterium mucogenicum DSM 44124]
MLRDPTDPWMDERALATPDPEPKTDPTPEHRRPAAIDACNLCDTDGMHNGFPCHHTDHAETARRHSAKIRAAMGWPAAGTPDTP